jgi:hypothetical protein
MYLKKNEALLHLTFHKKIKSSTFVDAYTFLLKF